MIGPRTWLSLALAVCVVAAQGCDSDSADRCGAPEIQPHLSPVNFGSLFVLGSGETADPSSRVSVPYEWVLLLVSDCEDDLEISEVCIVGDAHNGDASDPVFTAEGPVPAVVQTRQTAAVRLTYDTDAPNTDTDGDSVPDPDNIAVVVQSNAVNFPTLVVPICAAVIPRDGTPLDFECASPVSVPAGTRDDTLCP